MDPERTHWKLTLSYDGSAFHGWQVQPGLRTVQGTLAEALRDVSGEPLLPQGSGRTDAGVHALAQVASFSLRARIPAANLRRALNRVLPGSVRVLAAESVDQRFHARHSALHKTYQYRIFERRRDGIERCCSPFLAPFVWDCRWPVALDRLQAAALLLCGTHDFTSFAAHDPELFARTWAGSAEISNECDRDGAACAPDPCRTILRSRWTGEGDLLIYRVTGTGFLHHMVRNLVGTMVEAGRGRIQPDAMRQILLARNRAAAGPTAPARGLFLESVHYSEDFCHGVAPTRDASEPAPAIPS